MIEKTSWNSENILKNINEHLLANKWLKDILEVTYTYKDNFNITLFSDFAWLSRDSNHDDLLNITKQKLLDVTSEINHIINEINNEKSKNEKEDITLWYLYYIKNLLKITILWLPFEVQKATWNITLSKSEIEERIKNIEELETEVFWGLIKNNSFETTKSHEYIKNLLSKNSDMISENEFMFMNIVLSKIRSLDSYDDNELKPLNNTKNSTKIVIPDIDISREDYIQIFKLVLNIYDIKKDVIISDVKNMYDWDNWIEVPNNDKYKTIKLEKVLKMIAHELETHGIILDNNEKILGTVKWGWQLPREEWLAKIAEWILEWHTIDDFRNISFSLPEILAGELLKQEDYKKFIEIYLKLVWKDKLYSVSDRILRRKRNYPLDYIGVQHKDTTYSRWLIQIVEYISQWWNWEDLYTAKVNFDDINKAKKIRDKDHKHTKHPKLLSEIILYKLNNPKLDKNDFLKYLSEKYKWFLSKNDISKVNSLNHKQKKELIEILNIINQNK